MQERDNTVAALVSCGHGPSLSCTPTTCGPDGLGHWKHLGLSDATAPSDLLTAAIYLSPRPDGTAVYVATHGYGIGKTPMP